MPRNEDRPTAAALMAIASSEEAAGEYSHGDFVPGADVTIVKLLGSGGFASVYEALTTEGETVALKIIHTHLAKRSDVANAMVEEALTLGRLDHPNVVRLFDAGRTSDEKDRVYLVMERLKGINGRQMLLQKGRLPIQHAIDVLISLAEGLEAAHEIGVIHGDLKPDNIFVHLSPSGIPYAKLYDFGIQVKERDDPNVEEAIDIFMGTPVYAAPEQLLGRRVTKRTDIFAFGIMLFEFLTGMRPHAKAEREDEEAHHDGCDLNTSQLARAQLYEPAPSLSEALLVPKALEQLTLWCLEKDPERRPQSITEVKTILQHTRQHLHPRFISSKETTQQFLVRTVRAAKARHDSPTPEQNIAPAISDMKATAVQQPAGKAPANVDSHVEARRSRATPAPAELPLERPGIVPDAAATIPRATPLAVTQNGDSRTSVDTLRAEGLFAGIPRLWLWLGTGAFSVVLVLVGLASYRMARGQREAALRAPSVEATLSAAPMASSEAPARVLAPATTSVASVTLAMPVATLAASTTPVRATSSLRSTPETSPRADAPARARRTESDSGRGAPTNAVADARTLDPLDALVDRSPSKSARASTSPASTASVSIADQARALMIRDPAAARRLLESRLKAGRATNEELMLLKTICKHLQDPQCVAKCDHLIDFEQLQ